MGLRIKPSSSSKAYTKGDAAEAKRQSSLPVRGAGGRMESNPAKGSGVKSGSRPRTLGRIARRAGGTNAGGR